MEFTNEVFERRRVLAERLETSQDNIEIDSEIEFVFKDKVFSVYSEEEFNDFCEQLTEEVQEDILDYTNSILDHLANIKHLVFTLDDKEFSNEALRAHVDYDSLLEDIKENFQEASNQALVKSGQYFIVTDEDNKGYLR